jgi:hypothetical protein
MVPKCPTPTCPQHSPVAHPEPLQSFFHVAMNFWNISLAVMTFSFTCVPCCKIPSIVSTIMWVFSFFALSCTSYFTMPFVATSSSITQNASSYNANLLCTSLLLCYHFFYVQVQLPIFRDCSHIFCWWYTTHRLFRILCLLLHILQLLLYSLKLCILC